MKQTAMVK